MNVLAAPPIDRPTSSTTDRHPGHPFARTAALPVALACAVLLGACRPAEPEDSSATRATPRPVETESVVAVEGNETIRFPAATRATRRATLAFLQSGYLAERTVERGDRVEAGQRLAVLFNPALQPGVAAARGALAEAGTRLDQLQRDTERLQRLVDRELVSTDELEQVRAQRDAARATRDQAQARLDEAVAQLEEAVLRAPFAGRIRELHLEPGDFAAVGQPVMELIDETALEVELRLPAHRLPGLQDSLPARPVRRIDDGQRFGARLRGIGRAAPGQLAPVVLELEPGTDLGAGDAVEVTLAFDATAGVAVPLSAIINPGTSTSRVFRVREGLAEALSIQAGRLQGRNVTVFGDLQPGDEVIVSGHAQLLDGEPVRVLGARRQEPQE